MKFGCKTIGFFSLFLLLNVSLYGSTIIPKMKHAIQSIKKQPLETAKIYGCIAAKAAVIIYSGKIACKRIVKILNHFHDNEIKFSSDFIRPPFKSALITSGLAMLAFECGSSLIEDIKSLK